MDKRTPSLPGEVLVGDTTGPAVVIRYNSVELGKFCLLPNVTYLLFGDRKALFRLLLV